MYKHKLKEILEQILEASIDQGYTTNGLAFEANLGRETVRRLYNCKTRFPRLKTIFNLAMAVGMDLELKRISLPINNRSYRPRNKVASN